MPPFVAALVGALVLGEPRQAGDPGQHVEHHPGRAAAQAQGGAGEQHRERLHRQRHRGERQRHRDLRADPHECGGADHQGDVSDPGTG